MCEKVPYVKIFEFFLQKRFLKLHRVLLRHLKPSSSVSNYKKVIITCSLRRFRWVSWAGWPCRGSRTPSSPPTASGVDDEHQQSISISSTSSPWTMFIEHHHQYQHHHHQYHHYPHRHRDHYIVTLSSRNNQLAHSQQMHHATVSINPTTWPTSSIFILLPKYFLALLLLCYSYFPNQ